MQCVQGMLRKYHSSDIRLVQISTLRRHRSAAATRHIPTYGGLNVSIARSSALASATTSSCSRPESSFFQSFDFASSGQHSLHSRLLNAIQVVPYTRVISQVSLARLPEFQAFRSNAHRLRSNDLHGKVNRFKQCRPSIRYPVVPVVRMVQTYQRIVNRLDGYVQSDPRNSKTEPHTNLKHRSTTSTIQSALSGAFHRPLFVVN